MRIASDVRLLPLGAGLSINAYLAGDVLIDAGTRQSAPRLLALLRDAPLRAHALTHAHPDHQGATRAVCRARGVPLWASAPDARAMGSGDHRGQLPRNALARAEELAWRGPPHPAARVLREGDDVNGFEVLETPGHAPGHLAFWRARDRVLLLGDVLVNLALPAWRVRLGEPPAVFTVDAARNRDSIRRLAALEPDVVAFGHGPPILGARAFARQAEALMATW